MNETEAMEIADSVFNSLDVVHQDGNVSWSRELETLVVSLDGGGVCDLVDIASFTDDELHTLANLSGEHTMWKLGDYVFWSLG